MPKRICSFVVIHKLKYDLVYDPLTIPRCIGSEDGQDDTPNGIGA
jgi:hypothetical protein